MRGPRAWLSCVSLAAVATLAACGGDGSMAGGPSVSADDGSDGGSAHHCVDNDSDGYGRYCSGGRDCDDTDPDVTDECVRCIVAATDCPCERGLMPKECKPDDRQGDGGVFQCTEGTRYCRDGYWSACEAVGNYVFVPTQ